MCLYDSGFRKVAKKLSTSLFQQFQSVWFCTSLINDVLFRVLGFFFSLQFLFLCSGWQHLTNTTLASGMSILWQKKQLKRWRKMALKGLSLSPSTHSTVVLPQVSVCAGAEHGQRRTEARVCEPEGACRVSVQAVLSSSKFPFLLAPLPAQGLYLLKFRVLGRNFLTRGSFTLPLLLWDSINWRLRSTTE